MLIHKYYNRISLKLLENDLGSSFHQFPRLKIYSARKTHGSLHGKINMLIILHKNVAFKTMVTYTKEVIETWKRLLHACRCVFLNVSTTVIGAHHNGGLLFIRKHPQKVINYISCGVAEEKDCDIQTESIAAAELGGLSRIKNLITVW